MIYFCATSVFHLLVIIFLLETEYKDSKQQKTLILLDHVTNLMKYYSRLKDSGLWENVICIHTDKESHENIRAQLDSINFFEGDKFHFFGREFVSFSLLKKARGKAECIITDEVVLSYADVRKTILADYHSEWFQGVEFDFNSIDQIWMLDAEGSVNDDTFVVKDLNARERMGEPQFRKSYIGKLECIFPREGSDKFIHQICFFDVYYLQLFRCMSQELEKYLLEELADTLNPWDFAIKPHPGEKNYEKYENIESYIINNSDIPWEVMHFYNENRFTDKQIVISSCSSGALLNERLFFGDNTKIIFLNKIYEKYTNNSIDIYQTLPQFIKLYGEKNVYFPESFAELKQMVSLILGEDYLDLQEDYKKEQERFFAFLLQYYLNTWKLCPSLINFSSLLVLKDGKFMPIAERRISTKDGRFKISFSINKDNGKEHVRWYIVRSRKVSLRIDKIECKNETNTILIDLNTLTYRLGEAQGDGYTDMTIVEPSLEFDLPDEAVQEITISGTWKFDFSFEGMLDLLRKNIRRYDEHVKLLHKDIDERDSQLSALHKDLEERDHHLSLIYGDIKERDNHLKTVYKRLEKSEIHVELLKDDIAEKDEKIAELQVELQKWESGEKNHTGKIGKGIFRGWF